MNAQSKLRDIIAALVPDEEVSETAFGHYFLQRHVMKTNRLQ